MPPQPCRVRSRFAGRPIRRGPGRATAELRTLHAHRHPPLHGGVALAGQPRCAAFDKEWEDEDCSIWQQPMDNRFHLGWAAKLSGDWGTTQFTCAAACKIDEPPDTVLLCHRTSIHVVHEPLWLCPLE